MNLHQLTLSPTIDNKTQMQLLTMILLLLVVPLDMVEFVGFDYVVGEARFHNYINNIKKQLILLARFLKLHVDHTSVLW